jgi:hypothetical protein
LPAQAFLTMLNHLTTFWQHSLKVVMLLRHRCQRSDIGKLREHGLSVNALNVNVQWRTRLVRVLPDLPDERVFQVPCADCSRNTGRLSLAMTLHSAVITITKSFWGRTKWRSAVEAGSGHCRQHFVRMSRKGPGAGGAAGHDVAGTK